MKDGRIIYQHGYGMADLDHNVTITPSSVGNFKGECGHFCGIGHGKMKFTVHVTE